MNKIIVCPDAFKGSMKADEVARIMAEALREKYTETEVVEIALADGGEGTADVLMDKYPLYLSVMACDPLGRLRKAHYYTDLTGRKGLLETADVIGLPLILDEERNILKSSSYGVGEVILDAIRHGLEEITVSLGGSATCDGGMGMLIALGYRFLDTEGKELDGNGENLWKIARIDSSHLCPDLKNLRLRVLTDVGNPLLGISGAVRIFAPQKGASEKDMTVLESGMENFVNVVGENGTEKIPGVGAAGGLGYAFMQFLGVELTPGIDFILEELDFAEKIKGADLIVTGEGRVDVQSLMGKVLSGVLKLAANYGSPVVSISGSVSDYDLLKQAGLKEAYSLDTKSLSPEETYVRIKETIKSMTL